MSRAALARVVAAPRAAAVLRGAGARAASSSPLVELREYRLTCESASRYTTLAKESADLRREIFPLRLFTLPEAGGVLNVATHFYSYRGGHPERDAVRRTQQSDERWGRFSAATRPCIAEQRALLFAEAPLVVTFQLHGMQESSCPGGEASARAIYELRRYQLKLGYDTVPRFLEIYGRGLPSKLSAPGTDPSTSLLTVLYSEVGSLNEVIELRYPQKVATWRGHRGNGNLSASRKRCEGLACSHSGDRWLGRHVHNHYPQTGGLLSLALAAWYYL